MHVFTKATVLSYPFEAMEGSKNFLLLLFLIIKLSYVESMYLIINDTNYMYEYPEDIKIESKRIVKGENSNKNEFPWMAALVYEYPNGQSMVKCGGSLISPNVVMTAAHCIEPDLRRVKLGHTHLSSGHVQKS